LAGRSTPTLRGGCEHGRRAGRVAIAALAEPFKPIAHNRQSKRDAKPA
jgi:hypothetical protein